MTREKTHFWVGNINAVLTTIVGILLTMTLTRLTKVEDNQLKQLENQATMFEKINQLEK